MEICELKGIIGEFLRINKELYKELVANIESLRRKLTSQYTEISLYEYFRYEITTSLDCKGSNCITLRYYIIIYNYYITLSTILDFNVYFKMLPHINKKKNYTDTV